MNALLAQAGAFLDDMAAALHAGRAPWPDGALLLIDDPQRVRHVLEHPEAFVKNYAFLEDFSRGRFTANGEAWRQRAALTAAVYRAPKAPIDAAWVAAVYRQHLQGASALDAQALFDRFVAAAVEVYSAALGLPAALPWPSAWLHELRELLRLRQWIDWNGCAPEQLAAVQRELDAARERLRTQWRDDAGVATVLQRLRADGAQIDGFDAVEELAQNVLAATETTASSLLWIAEMLSRQPAAQAALRAQTETRDGFIDETLRLHPPVPLLTRRCVAAHEHAGLRVEAGCLLALSIAGMHRHPAHWPQPEVFDATRDHASSRAYMPYSRGARACAGARLARLELQGGLQALLAMRACVPGNTATGFSCGLASRPATSLRAEPIGG